MPGPNSAPNGDTTIVRGHVDEEFMCDIHAQKHMYLCEEYATWWPIAKNLPHCVILSKREWLAKRNRLRTGKTV